METITQEQRTANKDNRLKHAADPNDGLTVRLLVDTASGPTGKVVVLGNSRARDLIRLGQAETAE